MAVAAFCEAQVDGIGLVDVETDYLPHVIACENGGAGQAALEAQAVAARSYLYYRLERTGSVTDGQGDQVYTCARMPDAAHFDAAAATSGIVLRYADTQVAAFFVAGARMQPGPECRGSTDDPTNTERYVTYNEGLAGDMIMQSSLGLVDPGNFANRGCMSQNGADCLSDSGADFRTILRFYYGEDIGIEQAEGECVMAVDPGGDDGGAGTASGGCQAASGALAGALPVLLLFFIAAAPKAHRAPRPASTATT